MNKLIERLTSNIFGFLLLIWLFCMVVGNYSSIFAILDGKMTVYNPECLERSYDAMGGNCEEYGDGTTLSIKDNFIGSLRASSLITAGFALLFILGKIPEKIQQIKLKRELDREEKYYNELEKKDSQGKK